jgi:hypothetical protein
MTWKPPSLKTARECCTICHGPCGPPTKSLRANHSCGISNLAKTVGVLLSRKFRGRQKVGPWLAEGVRACGDKVITLDAPKYGGIFSDVLIFYGFDGHRESEITRAFREYTAAGRPAVYVDLGYFRRRAVLGRYRDYHRFSVNGRHPGPYYRQRKHPHDRINEFGIKLSARQTSGNYILLAGMSKKCAEFEGFKFLEWERDAVRQIRLVTDRPIHYRPKPNKYNNYEQLKGTIHSPPTYGILSALSGAWATVSHHSNAGIDGICAGVPAFVSEGVCADVGSTDLAQIENPPFPSDEERKQWLADVAYCQWNGDEMRSGRYWRHLKDEGLVG